MATDINTILSWFKTGLKPTQTQFWASWQSFWHKDEPIPQSSITNLSATLNAKAEKSQFDAHKTDPIAHIAEFNAKEDKNNKGIAGGYTPLDEFSKVLTSFLNVVNDLETGGTDAILTAEQGKLLQNQINGINTILTSNDVNLDTVQELVDAIKIVQTSLNTILINDLTTGGVAKALTAEMGKSLKASIDILATTINGKISTFVTTVKTIVSTALVTEDIAGFVAYINAISPVLVVGTNETVRYQTSNTGRIFEILLRGKSFGAGQPAINATDVMEITGFLNKDIKLSNYPNTRNDGQIPMNKILSTDASGNLKMYTIATAPAPFLEELIPDSYLPSTTGNFVLKGAFFTPTMTVVITGQKVNYLTFINDNEVRANVTTGATEGQFDVILNNGLQAVFVKRFLIIDGVVNKPIGSDYTNIVGNPILEKGEVSMSFVNQEASARFFNIPPNINIEVHFKMRFSPLYSNAQGVQGGFPEFYFLDTVTGLRTYEYNTLTVGGTSLSYFELNISYNGTYKAAFNGGNPSSLEKYSKNVKFRRINNIMQVFFDEQLKYTFTETCDNVQALVARVKYHDIYDIKYIELIS